MKKIVTGVFLLTLLAACASDELPTEESTAAVEDGAAVVEVAPEQAIEQIPQQTSGITSEGVVEKPAESVNEPATASLFEPTPPATVLVDALGDTASLLAKRSVFHSFNSDAVQGENRAIIQAHAKFLADNPGRKIRLEGNTDERGSSEYNLALGQRRANGVKKMLILGGANANQIESVSFGEEKPKATAHNESAWSQNRRTDIVYRTK
ncbi:MAG: peptidoglycan-associated lipoprotein Pal [Candidatus Nitrotoga sp.]